jgi:hypothetical protein
MSDVVATVSPRTLRAAHPAHTGRLAQISTRTRYPGRPVPGLTTHQAKGREWDVVGVRLGTGEQEALAAGLNVSVESHRQLYVACTRARRATMAISRATRGSGRALLRADQRRHAATELPRIQHCTVPMRITQVEAAVGLGESLSLSAICPWTAVENRTQRDSDAHLTPRTARPVNPRIPRPGAVSAGSGRCWVRTNVG